MLVHLFNWLIIQGFIHSVNQIKQTLYMYWLTLGLAECKMLTTDPSAVTSTFDLLRNFNEVCEALWLYLTISVRAVTAGLLPAQYV